MLPPKSEETEKKDLQKERTKTRGTSGRRPRKKKGPNWLRHREETTGYTVQQKYGGSKVQGKLSGGGCDRKVMKEAPGTRGGRYLLKKAEGEDRGRERNNGH